MTAEEILREQWAKFYKPAMTSSSSTPQTTEMHKKKYFDEIDNFGKSPMVTDDPITEWLASPPLANVTDPIAW
jgi:hypothetical protein